jgi:hypothetical protein
MEWAPLREMVVDSQGDVDKKSSESKGRRESPAWRLSHFPSP